MSGENQLIATPAAAAPAEPLPAASPAAAVEASPLPAASPELAEVDAVAAPPVKRRKRKPHAQLSTEERMMVRAKLKRLTCSEAWADAVMSVLINGDARGRRVIRHAVHASGRLIGDANTRYEQLLDAVQASGVYPPVADSPSSQMRPCFCRRCTRPGVRVGRVQAKPRHVFWPAHYMVGGIISYTCSVNGSPINEECLMEHLSGGRGGRGVQPGEAAEQIHYDADAWRGDSTADMISDAVDRAVKRMDAWERRELGDNPQLIFELPPLVARDNHLVCLLQPLPDQDVAAMLTAHRWSHVAGEVQISRSGRETGNTVRLMQRGLANVGSIADFFQLGHSLSEVRGLSAAQAELITELVNNYPRDPRPRQAAISWQSVRLGKRTKGKK
jgi:hypothetical protein